MPDRQQRRQLALGPGADRLHGLGGDDQQFGGDGDDRLEGGAGNDLLVGGRGADILLVGPGNGPDEVRCFEVGLDRVELAAYLCASADEVMAGLEDRLGGCVLDLGGGDILTFAGLAAADLQATDLMLGLANS